MSELQTLPATVLPETEEVTETGDPIVAHIIKTGPKESAAAKVLEDAKSDVSWGNQIRSYVLDQSRIKDLWTGVEIGNTAAVLDGDLAPFLEASLKQGL